MRRSGPYNKLGPDKRLAGAAGKTSGGQNSDVLVVFGAPVGPTGAANNSATTRSRTPAITVAPARGLVRVTYKAASGSALTLANASIGVWDGVAGKADTLLTPIELLFGGSSGFAISAGVLITSDWAVVAGMLVGKSPVTISDYGAANGNAVAITGLATPAATYLKAATASFSTTVTPAGSTETLGQMFDVIKIEFQ